MDTLFTRKFVEDQITEEAIKWWIKSCETFALDWRKYPTIEIIRGKSRVGEAWIKNYGKEDQECFLRFNVESAMTSERNYWDMINDTIPHEVCHLIAMLFFPMDSSAHGWAWQAVMVKMGKKPVKYACNLDEVKKVEQEFTLDF